jgi:hypothetical protein
MLLTHFFFLEKRKPVLKEKGGAKKKMVKESCTNTFSFWKKENLC